MMQFAFDEAHKAWKKGEVPVGAVIVDEHHNIIAKAHNLVEQKKDATAHAELLAIQKACQKIKSKNLSHFSIFVTLEPCAMCAMACAHARLRKIVFGAYDEKSGAIEQGAALFNRDQTHHKPEIIGGVESEKAKNMLQAFFHSKRM